MKALTGTRPLLKASLRQDRRAIAPWVLLISALSATSILAYALIFPDPSDRAALAVALGGNPALSLIFGSVGDLSTADGFNSWRAGQLGAFFAALMTIIVVVRNTRAQEDSGRAELLASGVLGRQSRLAVALLMATAASAALGVICFGLTIAVGGGLAATAVLSAGLATSGLVFAGVAAVAAQLGQDGRTGSSLAIATLGVLYVLRGYLDSSGAAPWTAWLTPFGWIERTGTAVDNDPRPLLAGVAAALLLALGAFMLQSGRDYGQGVVNPRPGPPRAGIAGNVWGLAWRLHRGALAGWTIAFLALGYVFGNLATSVTDLVASNPVLSQILAAGVANASDVTDAFIATALQITAIIASILGVLMVLRMWIEENELRLEPLLAGSLRRSTYLSSNMVVAFLASAVAMLVAGTTMGLAARTGQGEVNLRDVVLQAVATVPAVWVLVSLALLAVGAVPQLRLVAWVGVVLTFALTVLGPTFRLPDAVLDVSPLRHVPLVTAESLDLVGLAGLGLVVVLFTVVGFVGFRRRDVH